MTKQPRSTSRRERQAAAEELAIAALGFIAGEPEQLGRFLAMTGIGPDSLRDGRARAAISRRRARSRGGDEALLLAFAAAKRDRSGSGACARATCSPAALGTRHAMSASLGRGEHEPTRRTMPGFCRDCRRDAPDARTAARLAARRACCGIRNSTRSRSRMSTATPSMPRSRSATIRRSPTNR